MSEQLGYLYRCSHQPPGYATVPKGWVRWQDRTTTL